MKVIQYAFKLARTRPLTGEELGKLAQRMDASDGPADAERLQSAISRGFYDESVMPQIRRRNLPSALLKHLLERIKGWKISVGHLVLLADRLGARPEVSAQKWFHRFPEMIVCGEGELVKTLLAPGQLPESEEVK